MNLKDIKNLDIPTTPGIYRFYNKAGKIIYIGKAANLKSRASSYWQKSANHSPAKQEMMKEIFRIDWEETETEIEALLLEANLIKHHQPKYNIDLRDDKRFTYIKISIGDEIPGVFITRTIDKSGKYFGPFTSAGAVRETVKAIRKIWPYCTERKVKNKPCFYYQINRCAGPCGGDLPLDDYKREVIEPIIQFFSGKKKKIVTSYELRVTKLSKKEKRGKLNEEEASELLKLKFKILNMQKVLAHTNILSITEKYAADVVELAKVLSLPRVPQRIEGYDISNIFGRDAVGSMVVFKNGEPDKREYRKFKIKIGEGKGDDVGMMREVLSRRLKRVEIKNENSKPSHWSRPDLIIIDGGKGQLNGAIKEIIKSGLDIPVISISKGAGLRSASAPDKIFFPGEKQPLVLPLASPAIHIIKRVRDEAHRFAIKYHQVLRRKKLLKK